MGRFKLLNLHLPSRFITSFHSKRCENSSQCSHYYQNIFIGAGLFFKVSVVVLAGRIGS